MTLTLLATGLAAAVLKDEQPGQGGFDISAGMYGTSVSEWLRDVAEHIAGERRPSPEPEFVSRADFNLTECETGSYPCSAMGVTKVPACLADVLLLRPGGTVEVTVLHRGGVEYREVTGSVQGSIAGYSALSSWLLRKNGDLWEICLAPGGGSSS